VSQSVKSRP
ncbi:TPA: sodium channel subunit beta-3 precursor, partial [Bos taurus]